MHSSLKMIHLLPSTYLDCNYLQYSNMHSATVPKSIYNWNIGWCCSKCMYCNFLCIRRTVFLDISVPKFTIRIIHKNYMIDFFPLITYIWPSVEQFFLKFSNLHLTRFFFQRRIECILIFRSLSLQDQKRKSRNNPILYTFKRRNSLNYNVGEISIGLFQRFILEKGVTEIIEINSHNRT